MQYLTSVYNYCRILFIQWLDVTGIENSEKPNVKWIVYTHLGTKYRIPIKKIRGLHPPNNELSMVYPKELHEQIRGPYGDYHNQSDFLQQNLNIINKNNLIKNG